MIICSCYGITEKQYRRALRKGISKDDPQIEAAAQLEVSGATCQAGRGCGSCFPTLLALAEDEAARKKEAACLPKGEAISSIVG